MLPTKGLFQDIQCPFYDNSCNRPYCHFRHRKKTQEISAPLEEEVVIKEPEVPTYKPTPKSELANIKSHIPISYVPDLAFRSDRTIRPLPSKFTYKPTPLSILSSASKKEENLDSDEKETIREIKEDIASNEYNPEDCSHDDINFEDLSAEFDLINDIIEDKNKTKVEEVNNDKHKSRSHKSKHHKDKDKRKKRSRSKDRHKSRHKSKSSRKDEHRKSSSNSSSKNKHHKTKKKSSESEDENFETLLEDDEDDIVSECYKIFNEYKPTTIETKESTESTVQEEIPVIQTSKKRIAHSSSTNETISKINLPKPKSQINPAQMMVNRFKQAKRDQANNEQKNLMNEIKQTIKRSAPPSLLEAAKQHKIQKLTTKKIAPVQNVNSIQRAKARIEELAKQKATEIINKTPAQTTKSKRIAHIPDYSLSDIPDVLNADKSKLPINVRTRFLTKIADECVKLYLTKENAYNRALNEEFSCYEKCKVLTTYKNSAMLAVNRLRKELQEREKLGLGPISDGEPSNKNLEDDFKGQKFYENIKQYVLSDEDLDIHGYPKESSIPGQAIIKNRKINKINLRENQRKCVRCSKIYLVDDDGFVLYPEECLYHPLKKRTLRGEQTYLCCKSNDDTGCVTSNTHVTEYDSDLDGFQITMDPESDSDPRSYAVYALDCEMCYTIKGLELTRVTIVDSECKTVYETLVKPLNPIIDYNTTFSGITQQQMERTSTNILQVQANILHLCNSKTILIGHSLESDMKALKIIHGSIIDTSVLFPHKMGLPHKRALKMLASEYLKKIIQNNMSGHDSAEDAITCMELVKWKLKEELKLRGK